MEICNLPRGYGKTSYLIYRSHITQYPILCMSERAKDFVKQKAREMKIDIPQPLSVSDLKKNQDVLDKRKKLLVDEMPYVLSELLGIDIDTGSLSEREIF